MSETTIKCPSCNEEIKLSESLAAPLVAATREKFKKHLAGKEKEWEEKAAAQTERVRKEAEEKALLKVEDDLCAAVVKAADLERELTAKDVKLKEAQNLQAEMIRKERELEDKERELELTIEKRTSDSLQEVRAAAKKEAEEALQLKVSEKETTIDSMKKQIEELRRKSEQGSQQLQGEAQELELEKALSAAFPLDVIEPVGKGEFGGDTLQRVILPSGVCCGTILWESKRTKAWSAGWLPKLRKDQRDAKADVAILVTQAMPQDIKTFGTIDSVWVSQYNLAIPVAVLLRHALIAADNAKVASEGVKDKAELVYEYLSGPRFKQRVEAIIEAFTTMQMDLDKEKKAFTRMWAKRSEQINQVVESTAGMYGELQGIAGASLEELEGLEAPKLEDGRGANNE